MLTYDDFANVLNAQLLTYLPDLRSYVGKLEEPTKLAWHELNKHATITDLVKACSELRVSQMPHYEFGDVGQRIKAKCDKYAAERQRKAANQEELDRARYYDQATEPAQSRMLNVKALDARLDEEIGKLPAITASASVDPKAHAQQVEARRECRRKRMQRAKELARQFARGDA